MKANYLVCYDIADPRRLTRIFKLMSGRGRHLQYSVFYCSMTWRELGDLKMRILAIIDEEEDDVRIYPLPSQKKVIVMGCGDRVPEGVELFIE
jgi:CRISPR-associated protein Cas2